KPLRCGPTARARRLWALEPPARYALAKGRGREDRAALRPHASAAATAAAGSAARYLAGRRGAATAHRTRPRVGAAALKRLRALLGLRHALLDDPAHRSTGAGTVHGVDLGCA